MINKVRISSIHSLAMKPDRLIALIREAFADVEYPGDFALRGSNLGTEPCEVEEAFRGRCRWQDVPVRLLDEAPDGLSSALSFFSHDAFRFYMPAYLIADVNGALQRVDPTFHLCGDFEDKMISRKSNTWSFDRCNGFTPAQCWAIVCYLHYIQKRRRGMYRNAGMIRQSLKNYWLARADHPDPKPPSKPKRKKKPSRGRWEKDPEDLIK